MPAEPRKAAGPKSDKRRLALSWATITGISLLAVAAIAITMQVRITTLQHEADQKKTLSLISSVIPSSNDAFGKASTELLARPGVAAFKADPVFQTTTWTKYMDMNAIHYKEVDSKIVDMLRGYAEQLDGHDQDTAHAMINDYANGVQTGADRETRLSQEFQQAVIYTKAACAAAASGSTADIFITSWSADAATPRPSYYPAPGQSTEEARSIAEAAQVSAMTAGLKHLCP